MVFCPHCGAQLQDQSKFCTRCGGKLESGAAQSAVPQQVTGAALAALRPKHKPVVIIAIVLAVVLLLGVVAGVFFMTRSKADPRFVGVWQVAEVETPTGRAPAVAYFADGASMALYDDGSGRAFVNDDYILFDWVTTDDTVTMTDHSGQLFADGVVEGETGRLSITLYTGGDSVSVYAVKEESPAAVSLQQQYDAIVGSWYLVDGVSGDMAFTLADTPVDLFCLVIHGDGTARVHIGSDTVDYSWGIQADGSLQLVVPHSGATLTAVIDGDMLTFENDQPENYMMARMQRGKDLAGDDRAEGDAPAPDGGAQPEGDGLADQEGDGPAYVEDILTQDYLIGLWSAYLVDAYGSTVSLEDYCGSMDVNFVSSGGWCAIGGDVAEITWEIIDNQLYVTRAGYMMTGYRMGDTLVLEFADEEGVVSFYLTMTGQPG